MPYDEYDIPDDWTPFELVDWINVSLAEPGVHSVEIFYDAGNLVARTWYEDPAGS